MSSLQSEHLGVVVGHSASFATGGGGVLLCSLVIGKPSVDEVMAAIAVHNIPEGIAIAMPVRSSDGCPGCLFTEIL